MTDETAPDSANMPLLPPGMTLECSKAPILLYQRAPGQKFAKAMRLRKCPDTGEVIPEIIGEEVRLPDQPGSIGMSQETYDILFK